MGRSKKAPVTSTEHVIIPWVGIGYAHKKRSLRTLLTRYDQASELRSRFIDHQHKGWFQKVREQGVKHKDEYQVWGLVDERWFSGSHGGDKEVLFIVDGDGSLSTIWLSDGEHYSNRILVVPHNELLLHVYSDSKHAKDIAEKRLKGELPDPPRNDALVNEYFYNTKRLEHMYRVTSRYKDYLHHLLYVMYSDEMYYMEGGRRLYPRTDFLVSLHMDDRVFRFLYDGKDFKEIRDSYVHVVE